MHWIEDNLIDSYEPTVTAGIKSHAEGVRTHVLDTEDVAYKSLYQKVDEDISKRGIASQLGVKKGEKVCAFTRPNSNGKYLKDKLTHHEQIVVDKIAASENSNSYFARISECFSDELSKEARERYIGCWVSLGSSNLVYQGGTLCF